MMEKDAEFEKWLEENYTQNEDLKFFDFSGKWVSIEMVEETYEDYYLNDREDA